MHVQLVMPGLVARAVLLLTAAVLPWLVTSLSRGWTECLSVCLQPLQTAFSACMPAEQPVTLRVDYTVSDCASPLSNCRAVLKSVLQSAQRATVRLVAPATSTVQI
jgi:hypothetical protein